MEVAVHVRRMRPGSSPPAESIFSSMRSACSVTKSSSAAICTFALSNSACGKSFASACSNAPRTPDSSCAVFSSARRKRFSALRASDSADPAMILMLKWKFDDCGVVTVHIHGLTRLYFAADVGHGNSLLEQRRFARTRDLANDFLIDAAHNFRVRFRHWASAQQETTQMSIYMAAMQDADDDFLTGITAFAFTDRALPQSSFERNDFFRQLRTPARRARLDAQRFQLFERQPRQIRQRGYASHEEIDTRISGVRRRQLKLGVHPHVR